MSKKNDKGWFGFSEWADELRKSREELRKTNELMRLTCWVSLAVLVATLPGGFILIAIFCFYWWRKRHSNRDKQ